MKKDYYTMNGCIDLGNNEVSMVADNDADFWSIYYTRDAYSLGEQQWIADFETKYDAEKYNEKMNELCKDYNAKPTVLQVRNMLNKETVVSFILKKDFRAGMYNYIVYDKKIADCVDIIKLYDYYQIDEMLNSYLRSSICLLIEEV